MANDTVRPGQIYRHWKHDDLYEIICTATYSESESTRTKNPSGLESLVELVVYRRLRDGTRWVRPLTMFTETIERDGRMVARFALEQDHGEEAIDGAQAGRRE